MPSKKRSNKVGKKGKKGKSNAAQKKNAEEVSSLQLDVQLAQMQLSDRPLSSQNNDNQDLTECTHGFIAFPDGHVCKKIVDELVQVMQLRGGNDFQCIANVLFSIHAHAEALEDEDNSKWIQSYFVAQGTKHILDENDKVARLFAFLAGAIEQVHMAMADKGSDFGKLQGIAEILTAVDCRATDDRTIISLFKKRIPCQCLDEKYERVKSQKKTGRCYNKQCTLPLRTAQRNKMMTCSQCRMVHYCSRECQVVDWPKHRKDCKDYVAVRKLTTAARENNNSDQSSSSNNDDVQLLKAILDKWKTNSRY
jgi:hypothetical protein